MEGGGTENSAAAEKQGNRGERTDEEGLLWRRDGGHTVRLCQHPRTVAKGTNYYLSSSLFHTDSLPVMPHSTSLPFPLLLFFKAASL